MTKSDPILCGACKVEAEVRADAKGDDMAVCPSCGRNDTIDKATEEAADYLTDKLSREMLGGFGSRSSDTLKVTVTEPPKRTYRWIVKR